jgi:hypothetical protein
MAGKFYLQSLDRSAGIRVVTSKTVNRTALADVWGTLATVNGERQITAWDASPTSSGGAAPLRIMAKALNAGVNLEGLLVTVAGRINGTPTTSYFYVDDGSRYEDGLGLTGVRVIGSIPATSAGKFATVTGICGTDISGTKSIKVARTRGSGDISVTSVP